VNETGRSRSPDRTTYPSRLRAFGGRRRPSRQLDLCPTRLWVDHFRMRRFRLGRKRTRKSTVAATRPFDGPHDAVRADRGHPSELPGVDYAWRSRVVGAGLECRTTTSAAHVADPLHQPPRRQRRVGKHTDLAAPRIATTQRENPVTRVERRPHRVLEHREPAHGPASQRMVSAHSRRVG